IRNAYELLTRLGLEKDLPIVPLFESEEALRAGCGIVVEWLKENPVYKRLVESKWNGRYEVMLGYSDSSKQSGPLFSRHLIHSAMYESENELSELKLKHFLFHGSGGSVARGGGSVQEQISFWPSSALEFPILTIQGEMVQRSFASPEILRSMVIKFF